MSTSKRDNSDLVAEPSEWPAPLAGLPVCPVRKLPVPFSAEWDETGRAVFTALDPARKDEIVRYRLCGVCGRPLGYWFVFLGDEVSAMRRCTRSARWPRSRSARTSSTSGCRVGR